MEEGELQPELAQDNVGNGEGADRSEQSPALEPLGQRGRLRSQSLASQIQGPPQRTDYPILGQVIRNSCFSCEEGHLAVRSGFVLASRTLSHIALVVEDAEAQGPLS